MNHCRPSVRPVIGRPGDIRKGRRERGLGIEEDDVALAAPRRPLCRRRRSQRRDISKEKSVGWYVPEKAVHGRSVEYEPRERERIRLPNGAEMILPCILFGIEHVNAELCYARLPHYHLGMLVHICYLKGQGSSDSTHYELYDTQLFGATLFRSKVPIRHVDII